MKKADVYDNPPDRAIRVAQNFDCCERYHMVYLRQRRYWYPFAFKRRCDASRWCRRNGFEPVHWYSF
jgi:hypothetical protein